MESKLESLGQAVRAHRADGGGLRLPPQLRDRIITAARQARSAGKSMNAIATLVGVSSQSIMRWLRPAESPAGPRLVPVRLAAAARPSGPDASTLTLISPSGWKIFGLDVSQAATLLRAVQ